MKTWIIATACGRIIELRAHSQIHAARVVRERDMEPREIRRWRKDTAPRPDMTPFVK
jgi:hypothetical protein